MCPPLSMVKNIFFQTLSFCIVFTMIIFQNKEENTNVNYLNWITRMKRDAKRMKFHQFRYFYANVCKCEYAQNVYDDLATYTRWWRPMAKSIGQKIKKWWIQTMGKKTRCEQMKRMNKHTRKHRSAITKNGESLIIHKNN